MDVHTLQAALLDLLQVDQNGQLSELLTQHANEARQMELPSDGELFQPMASFRIKQIAKAGAQLGLGTEIECGRQLSEALRRRPRQELALNLIEFHLDDGSGDEPEQKPQERRRRITW